MRTVTAVSDRQATPATRRGVRIALGVAVAVELLIALAAVVGGGRDTTSGYSIDDAVRDFRDSPPAGVPESGGSEPFVGPAPGVYRYRTDGFEKIDIFGGSRHDYPAETTMIVRPDVCGVRVRWQPLNDRWEERFQCVGRRGINVLGITNFRKFFGQAQVVGGGCDENALWAPATAAGDSWTAKCANPQGYAIELTAMEVGEEVLAVGDRNQPVVRIDAVWTITGEGRSSTTTRSIWLVRASGLIVRMQSKTDSQVAGPTGAGEYHEEFQLDLLSLTPRT